MKNEKKKERKPKNRNDRRTLADSYKIHKKRIVDMYRIFPGKSVFLTVLLALLSVQSYLMMVLVRQITNAAQSLASQSDAAALKSTLSNVLLLLGGILLLQMVAWIKERQREKLTLAGRQYENTRLTMKRSRIKYEYFEDKDMNDKIDMAQYVEFQYMHPLNLASELFSMLLTLILYGIALAQAHILFFFGTLLLGVGGFLMVRLVQSRMYKIYKEENAVYRERWAMMMLSGDRRAQSDMQTNRLFHFWRDYLADRNKKIVGLGIKNTWLQALFGLLPSIIMAGAILVGVFYIAGRAFVDKNLDVGFFTMFVSMMVSIYGLIHRAYNAYMQSERFSYMFESYYDVVELEEDIYDDDFDIFGEKSTLSLKNLRYKYPRTDRYVLDGLDLSFHSGEKIAVVGHNGCGKTTLVSILMGVLQSYEGEVAVDGTNVKGKLQNTLRRNTSCILQDFCQYQLTVRENIEVGNQGKPIPDEKHEELLRKVGLYDEVMDLPQGLDTHLGQLFEGVELSKGQWQRLAIARLLANEEARIWILDEPTAYLDPISEIEIYKLIYSLSGNRLVFFISHRLGFARQADRILLIDDGKLAEEGTHAQLMGNNGVYHDMFASQQDWYKATL